MADRNSTPPNPTPGRRPMDTFDSLRPSSLPPELASLDMQWDDDPRSVATIDLLHPTDLDLDVDEGERTTAIPEIPMDQLVQETMAEADAREAAHSLQCPAPSVPLSASHLERRENIPRPEGFLTQPAPARTQVSPGSRAQCRDHSGDDGGVLPGEDSTAERDSRSAREPSSQPPGSVTGTRANTQSSVPPTLRNVEAAQYRNQMKDRYATGDFSGALSLAESLLVADAGDLEAQRFATSCRDILTQMLSSKIGSFQQVVERSLGPEELRWLTLDHRAGFILSLVDDSSTVDELLDISGMARLETLRILAALLDQRVLRLVAH